MTDEGARLEAIWVKRAKRGPMDPRAEAVLEKARGISGNANQGGRRQVTIIEREAWRDMMVDLSADIDPSARRANLMVTGLSLENSRGKLLVIGSCIVRIRGETRPCERMDEALPGLRAAMDPGWRGGAYGEVIEGGRIRVGDPVALRAER